jgi:competence protein ComEA
MICWRVVGRNRSSVRSLMLKLAMLAVTAAVVVWIGWPGGDDLPTDQGRALPETPADPAASEAPPAGAAVLQPGDRARPDTGVSTGRLDINRATLEEFEQLPGIGQTLAQRILEARRRQGAFQSIEDLRNVKGIGRKRMDQLRPLVTAKPVSARASRREQTPVAGAAGGAKGL